MTIFAKGRDKAQKTVSILNKEYVKVPIKMDVILMNNIISYILNMDSRSVTFKSLISILELFKRIDESVFKDDNEMAYYTFIYNTLDYIINERRGTMTWNQLEMYLKEEFQSADYRNIIENLETYRKSNEDTLRITINAVTERLNFIHLHIYEESVRECFDKLLAGDYPNYRDINEEMKVLLTGLLTKIRQSNNTVDENSSISLDPDLFEGALVDIVAKLRDKSRVLRSGNKRMNMMLSPGWIGGKLYLYCGVPNAGKTFTLTKALVDIKKYNKGITTKKIGKRPTVLLVTMEDSVPEIMPRIFSMIRPDLMDEMNPDSDHKMTVEQIVNELKHSKELTLEDDDDIDMVIRYFPNRSIDTSDLYGIIEEIQDNNREVVCLILDYVKRIKPAEHAEAEHLELKNVTNELRSLAIAYDIPVLTAAQLTKEALKNIEAAKQSKKSNSALAVGASMIGNSFAMVENADCVIIINQEDPDQDGIKSMSFKRVKIRYKDTNNVAYFTTRYDDKNHHLLDDIELPSGEYVSKLLVDEEYGAKKLAAELPPVPTDFSPSNGLMDPTALFEANMINSKQ